MKNRIITSISTLIEFIRKPIVKRITLLFLGFTSTVWFLIRVIPKPSRATYPCMQASAPMMSAFVVWLIGFFGTNLLFVKAKQHWKAAKYIVASLLFIGAIGCAFLLSPNPLAFAQEKKNELKIWYKANEPLGVAKGIFPGRVAWGHNPKIASWDGKNGFWWDDKFNNQAETDRLFTQTLLSLTNEKTEKKAWNALFLHFNKAKKNVKLGYQKGQKVAIKINMNNTNSLENTNEINANPQLIFSLLKSLVNVAGIAQGDITLTDPSRFLTNNIFDKCHAVFPDIHYVDHNGGYGREKAVFVANAMPYSVDNGKVATGLAACMIEADYIIDMALMKGHVSQGVTLCAKNFFGCTSIEDDWRKNAHSAGFSQNRKGEHTYSVYPDYMGHKDLGAKTFLFLIDGIYSNKFVNNTPAFKWNLTPFNGNWPNSLFASQDGVAIDAVVLDFVLAEWPDAPDMMYSDYSNIESALADNPPSGTKYDPERDGSTLKSLGVTEHWNNPQDKKYSRNLKTGNGIELIYKAVK